MRWTPYAVSREQYRPWFAWHPVRVRHRTVWLEWLERREYPIRTRYGMRWLPMYRFPQGVIDERAD